MNIGKKIKKLRLERNMSQEKLAKMLGISRESISQYENNKIIPPVNVLEEIAEVFNVPVKYFFEEETEEVGEDNTKYFSDLFPSNSMGFMVGTSSKHPRKSQSKQKQFQIPVFRLPIISNGEEGLIKVSYIEYLKRNDVDFALRLNSDVMEPFISQNALLLVKNKIQTIMNGDLIVYKLNGKYDVRWFVENNGDKILAAENRKYKDIIIKPSDRVLVFGIVIGFLYDIKPHKKFL